MANRPFPSFWMYKDVARQWRWVYHAANGKAIAVSSEAYHNRGDCEHSIGLIQGSGSQEIWLPSDLAAVR